MALRQFAVFRNAGSYVIRPKSSGLTLICRRSMARIVSSVTGTSYCFPVRLSVIESVSAIMRTSTVRRLFRRGLRPARQAPGRPRRPTARDPGFCSACCRTDARPDPPGGACRIRTIVPSARRPYMILCVGVGSRLYLDGGLTFAGVVPHIAGRHHEDHVFGDVGGVVTYPLEVAGNQDEVERCL